LAQGADVCEGGGEFGVDGAAEEGGGEETGHLLVCWLMLKRAGEEVTDGRE
jgi:hypothetical protein